jgi:multiple sugar transport system permease protein
MATAAPGPRRGARRISPFEILRFAFIALFVLFVLAPLYWVAVTSIKPVSDYLTTPPVWFPAESTFVHYTAALFAYRGLEGLTNSFVIATATTALSALLGTLMGYSLARFDTGGPHLSFWVLSQRFLPPIAIVLPVFLLYRGIGLYDSRIGLILIYTVITLPLSVWMMYAYFRQLPKEMEEAALVDGCTRLRALISIILPLTLPALVVVTLFSFTQSWNEFLYALVFISSDSQKTFTVGLIGLIQGDTLPWSLMMAAATLGLIPPLIVYVISQRWVVSGLAAGSVKG